MSQKAVVRFALALLVATFALSAWLARQAVDAAAAHRELAVRAVRDHATFAAWQAATHVRTEISAAHYSAFLALLNHLRDHPTARPDRELLERMVRGQRDVCECTDGIRFFFTLDPDGRLDAGAGSDSAARRWVRDTIAHLVRTSPSPGPPGPVVVRNILGRTRRLAVMLINSTPGSLYGRPGGVPSVVVHVVTRDSLGVPVRTYGFVSAPEAFARPLFARVLAHQQLLPSSLTGTVDPESLIALTVTDPTGHALYRPVAAFPDSFVAVDSTSRSQGSLRLKLALNPVLADRIVGGLPDSRLPTFGAVLLLSAGMIALVWVTLRRQQALVRLRDDFVASVSHELRTPLAQIRLLAELLQRGRAVPDESRERSARIIDKEARRLSYLVENLLSFARTGRKLSSVAPVPLDLVQEVHEIVESFAPLLQQGGTRVAVDADRPVMAAVDPAALRQILLNLLDNANRYGPSGQQITVALRQLNGTARIAVEDHGPGIPLADRRRIFAPYHRLAREQRGTVAGTGLGLAVVRELVEQHRGRVVVEDSSSGGARFVVDLPSEDQDSKR